MDANMQMALWSEPGVAPADNPQALPQPQRRSHFFSFPPEIRNRIYREALITPFPNVVHSLVPAALLQTNSYIRQEAITMYYTYNHFEVTIKRARRHQGLDPDHRGREADRHAWRRFFTMWIQFGSTGLNVLQYITRITLIYQLSLKTGFDFGTDAYDKRIGLRFYGGTREEDQGATYGEAPMVEDMDVDDDESGYDSDSDTDMDTDSIDSDEYEYREMDADDIEDLDDELAGLGDEANADLDNPVHMMPINSPPAPDIDVLGVYELVTEGDFTWPSRRATYNLLYDTVNAFETTSNNIWRVYPCRRLSVMMFRCARDCPLATQSVDFLSEDYQHWMDGDQPYREYGPRRYDPDQE